MKNQTKIDTSHFLNEFLFKTQFNQKISIYEFLYSISAIKIYAFFSFLYYFNPEYRTYIVAISVLLFLYFYRSSRIIKKEKYLLKSKELYVYSFFSSLYKKILKNIFFSALFLIFYTTEINASFSENISESIDTQQENINLVKEEIDVFINSIQVKMTSYFIKERTTLEMNKSLELNNLLNEYEIMKSKIKLNGVKNEVPNNR